MKRVLVMIPAYNEALNIKKTIMDLQEYASDLDYIVINDGSKDNTRQVLEDNHLNYIDGFCNQGLAGAVQMGFKYAMAKDYDIAIQFDGDGQHKAAYIKSLIQTLENGCNIAIGSRFLKVNKPWTLRMLGSRCIGAAIALVVHKRFRDPTSGFRAYDKDCIQDFAMTSNMPPEPDTLVYMIRKGRKIQEVQVEMQDREFGNSYLNLGNTVKYMSRMMISILLIQPFRKV